MPTPTNAPVLSWTASNDDSTGGSGVVGYHVFRDGQLIATPSSPNYADAIPLDLGLARLLDHGHRRRRQREPRLADPRRRDRPRSSAGTAGPRRAQPDPATVAELGRGDRRRPGPIAIDHYNVYRDGTLIARSTTTSYVDTRVTTSGQFSYTVRAVDLAGNVGPSSTPVAVTVDMTGPTLQNLSDPARAHGRHAGVLLGRRGRPSGLDRGRSGLELRRRLRARHHRHARLQHAGCVRGHGVRHRCARQHHELVAVDDHRGPATVAKASIKAPAPLRLKALRTLGWRVQTTVTLGASANVTVRLHFGKKTIAQTTRNVPDGPTAISLTVPKGYRRKGTFALTLRVAGSTA